MKPNASEQTREVRAIYDDKLIRVYQAFRSEIAFAALAAQKFVAPFSLQRMSWIKPSFNWMMYRCGYGAKEGQEVVLGIDILREGFDWALQNAVLSHHDTSVENYQTWRERLNDSCVRVQWDPERDWKNQAMKQTRAIQLGLSGKALASYAHEWTARIFDVTPLAKRAMLAAARGVEDLDLPYRRERLYPLNRYSVAS
jgi:hypothetical protein